MSPKAQELIDRFQDIMQSPQDNCRKHYESIVRVREELEEYITGLEFKASIVDNAPVVEPPPCQP